MHILRGQFNLVATSHNYMTRNSVNNKVPLPSVRTTVYGIKSIRFQSVREWNFFVEHFKSDKLREKSKYFCKKKLRTFLLDSY